MLTYNDRATLQQETADIFDQIRLADMMLGCLIRYIFDEHDTLDADLALDAKSLVMAASELICQALNTAHNNFGTVDSGAVDRASREYMALQRRAAVDDRMVRAVALGMDPKEADKISKEYDELALNHLDVFLQQHKKKN